MFENEIAINNFLLGYMKRIVADIPANKLNDRAHNNAHPPVWILGHLAWSGEFGGTFCGEAMKHESWTSIFGIDSSDEVVEPEQFDKDELLKSIEDGFVRLRELAREQSPDDMDQPHGIPGLDKSAVRTKGHMICHLLTSHFSFHISQLSAWRRASGEDHLF